MKYTVFLFTFSWIIGAFAAKPCDVVPPNVKLFEAITRSTCENLKKSEFCQQAYAEIKNNGEKVDDKALRCEIANGHSRAFEEAWSYTSGCAIGGWDMIKNTFVDIGTSIGEGAAKAVIDTEKEREENKICDKDINYKKTLFTGYNQTVPSILKIKTPDNDFLNRMDCSYLKLIVREKKQEVFHDVETQISKKEFWSFVKKPTFTTEEKEFIKWRDERKGQSLLVLAKQKLKEMGVKVECYNSQAAAAMTCEAIAEVATLAAGPAGAALKAAKVRNIMGFAGLIGDAKKAAEGTEVAQGLKGLRATAAKVDARVIKLMRPPAVDGEKLKNAVAPIWKNSSLSDDEKVRATFKKYSEMRMEKLDPEKKVLADKALNNIDKTKSSSFYDPKTGKITMRKNLDDDAVMYNQILAHEFEHLTQFGTDAKGSRSSYFARAYKEMIDKQLDFPKVPVTGTQAEYEAIGAQWDFLQAIPEEIRKQALVKVSQSTTLSEKYKKVMTADIENASLTRAEYIKEVPQHHGYTTYDEMWNDRFDSAMRIGAAILLVNVSNTVEKRPEMFRSQK